MQLADLKRHVQAKINELKSMPAHGDEIDGYAFDESEFLDYFAQLVREAFIKTDYPADPPSQLLSKSDALYWLRKVQTFLASKEQRSGVVSPPQLAREWKVSPDKVLGWIRSGQLKARNVSNGIRPRYQIDRKDLDSFRPPADKPAKRTTRKPDPNVIEYY